MIECHVSSSMLRTHGARRPLQLGHCMQKTQSRRRNIALEPCTGYTSFDTTPLDVVTKWNTLLLLLLHQETSSPQTARNASSYPVARRPQMTYTRRIARRRTPATKCIPRRTVRHDRISLDRCIYTVVKEHDERVFLAPMLSWLRGPVTAMAQSGGAQS